LKRYLKGRKLCGQFKRLRSTTTTVLHLEDVPGFEGDACLSARDQLVLEWVVVELRSHEDLGVERQRKDKMTKTVEQNSKGGKKVFMVVSEHKATN
jgi:hypothetical protein